MFPTAQTVRPGLPRWGHSLLLAVLIGLFVVGQAAAVCATAPAVRQAEPKGPPGEGEEESGHTGPSLPAAPRSVRPPASAPAFVRLPTTGPRSSPSALPSRGRPLSVSGLPPALPLRC